MFGQPPSLCMGLTPGSYEAYCLDQACWYLGVTITKELHEAGQKKSKAETKAEAARKKVLDKYFGTPGKSNEGFADPALLFQ